MGGDNGDLSVFAATGGGGTWRRERSRSFGGLGYQRGSAVAIVAEQVVIVALDDTVGAVWVGQFPPGR